MKKVLVVLLLVFIALNASRAQEVVIPQVVSQQLTALFTKASNIKWTSQSKEKYLAEFDDNGIIKTAVFSDAGDLLQTFIPVSVKDFPLEVSNSLFKNFPDFEISHSVKIEIGKEVSFRVRVRKGGDLFEVEFDLFGKIKSKVKIGSGKEDEHEKYEKDCEEDGEYCERHHKKHKVKHKEKQHPHKKGKKH